MAAIELLAGAWPSGSAAGTPITMATGDTLQIRNAPMEARPFLAQSWVDSDVDFQYQIKSPHFHDNVEGIRLLGEAANIVPLIPDIARQLLHPQDILTVVSQTALGPSNVAGAGFLVYYPDMPGISARLMTAEEVRERMVDIHNVRVLVSASGSPNWQGALRITQNQDLMRANTDYAWLGYQCDRSFTCIALRGVETGNLRIGGPGENDERWITTNWFVDLSMKLGLPCIPVFNSANKNAIFLDVIRTGSAVTDAVITLYLARFRE